MGICKDKATTYLNRLGYNTVRIPQAGIHPLQLIGQRKKGISILGGIERLITNPPAALPTITRDQRSADLEGQESSKLDLAIGLGVLGTFIGAMGGNVGIKSSYARAQKIQFRFQDVLVDRVMPLDVGNYLRAGDVDEDNVVLEQFVLGKGQLYLITETVKTRKLTVVTERKDGTQVDLEVPAIAALMEGKLGVKADAERSSTITYEGPEYLVFGFRAFLVGVEDGGLSMMAAGPGHVALDGDDAAAELAEPAILEDGGLLDLSSEDELEED